MIIKPLIMNPKNGRQRKEALLRIAEARMALRTLHDLGTAIYRIDQARAWLVEQQTQIATDLRKAGVPMQGNIPVDDWRDK